MSIYIYVRITYEKNSVNRVWHKNKNGGILMKKMMRKFIAVLLAVVMLFAGLIAEKILFIKVP